MKKGMFIVLFGFSILWAGLYAKTVFTDIVNQYEISVRWDIDSSFFPDSWKKEPIAAQAVPIKQAELPRMAEVLKQALASYSKDFIKRNLRGVYLTQEIKFYGQPYGATSSNDVVYLNNKGVEKGYTNSYLAGCFHHELGHILFRNYQFPKKEWMKANPKNFNYSGSGVDAIKNNQHSLKGSEALFKKGFLSQYSQSALEEDFSVFTEKMLMEKDLMKKLIKKYPVIEKKYKIWAAFYKKINSGVNVTL